MRVTNFDRYSNTPDSRVPIQGMYARNVTQVAKAFFRIAFRNVKLNRKEWQFDIHLVDADESSVKEFLKEYPMCHIENTFSEVSQGTKTKSKSLA